MGDRSNIVIRQEKGKPPLVIYGHWLGAGHIEAVTLALGRGVRFDDPGYLSRIIFCHAIKACGGTLDDETGFGLSVGYLCDNEYPVLYVDIPKRQVSIRLAVNRPLHHAGKWVEKEWKPWRTIGFQQIMSLPLAWEEWYTERYPDEVKEK